MSQIREEIRRMVQEEISLQRGSSGLTSLPEPKFYLEMSTEVYKLRAQLEEATSTITTQARQIASLSNQLENSHRTIQLLEGVTQVQGGILRITHQLPNGIHWTYKIDPQPDGTLEFEAEDGEYPGD